MAKKKERRQKKDRTARGAESQRRMAEWLRGRNGSDELATAVVFLSFILLIIDIFVRQTWLTLFALALLAYAWFRMSSTKVQKRRDENEWFLHLIGPAGAWLRDPEAAAKESSTYKHGTCPNCGQKVRVPRGKGRLRVTCPKCGTKFEIRS